MVSFGCVAKVLSGLQCRSNVWIKTVNPNWYEAREIPKAILANKVVREMREKPKITESTKKAGTPMSQPYF